MFKVKARFIGKSSLVRRYNGFCIEYTQHGFISGNIYEFIIFSLPHIGKGYIEIETECKKRIEYKSWELFIPDWEILKFNNMTGEHDAEVHHSKVNNGLKSAVRESKLNKLLS